MKDMTVLEKSLTVRSALKEDQLAVLDEITEQILASLKQVNHCIFIQEFQPLFPNRKKRLFIYKKIVLHTNNV